MVIEEDIPLSLYNPFRDAKSLKAVMSKDKFVIKNSKTWYLVDEIEEQTFKLYLSKDVSKILHTKNFKKTTEMLVSMGLFTTEHYFCITDGVDKNNEPVTRELWTNKGIKFLESLFVISKEEEEDFIAHFYFIEETLGEDQMILEIAERYNILFSEGKNKKASIIKTYLTGSWGSFKSKNKEEFDKYMIIMKEIRKEIENNEFDESLIKKIVFFEDMKI